MSCRAFGLASRADARHHPGRRAPRHLRQDDHQRSFGGHPRHARHHAGDCFLLRQEGAVAKTGAGEALGSAIWCPCGANRHGACWDGGEARRARRWDGDCRQSATELAPEPSSGRSAHLVDEAEEWLAKEARSRSVFRVSSSDFGGATPDSSRPRRDAPSQRNGRFGKPRTSEPSAEHGRTPSLARSRRSSAHGDLHSFEPHRRHRPPRRELASFAAETEHRAQPSNFAGPGLSAAPRSSLSPSGLALGEACSAPSSRSSGIRSRRYEWPGSATAPNENDLLQIFGGRDAAREALARFARLAGRRFLVAVAPSGRRP